MGDEERGLPPAGWYADPEGGAGQRYWDGERWTDDRRKGTTAAAGGRRFTSLHVIATVYFVLGIAVAVLGAVGVLVAAIEQSDDPDRFDNAEPAAIVIIGGLYVAFVSLTLIAASAFIRLMLSVEESTRRTATAVETLRSD
jgi:Protein of unknown function (DUF2510)